MLITKIKKSQLRKKKFPGKIIHLRICQRLFLTLTMLKSQSILSPVQGNGNVNF